MLSDSKTGDVHMITLSTAFGMSCPGLRRMPGSLGALELHAGPVLALAPHQPGIDLALKELWVGPVTHGFLEQEVT